MKITILAIGSRGDVQPYVALGVGLQAVGYDIQVVAHSTFEGMIRDAGLGFFPLRRKVREMGELEDTITDRNPIKRWQKILEGSKLIMLQIGDDCWQACQSADAIIYGGFGYFFGPHIAEKLNLPLIGALYTPEIPTRDFPSYTLTTERNWGGLFNFLTYIVSGLLWWGVYFRPMVNHWRRETLNLPPANVAYETPPGLQKAVLCGFSPNVIPRPADWPEQIHVTGYWFLNSTDWQPPSDLLDFLEAGPPPVYIGFGSMISDKPEEMTQLVLQALARSKQRGLLLTGWGGLSQRDLPETVFMVKSAPHDWLFPRMATVVHHGGAGTTAAGLRSGRPSVVVPFVSTTDQPFWGQQVYKLGVGPRPIPRQQLSVERLAAAITMTIEDQEMQKRAAALGERIRAEEDGVAQAVKIVERCWPKNK